MAAHRREPASNLAHAGVVGHSTRRARVELHDRCATAPDRRRHHADPAQTQPLGHARRQPHPGEPPGPRPNAIASSELSETPPSASTASTMGSNCSA
jgi:hypothetical protein